MGARDNLRISWMRRSLLAFGEQSIEELASAYDMVIIDHPSVGEAVRSGCFVPLDTVLSREFLQEQRTTAAGPSHESYFLDGHQWALAIDAATQVSACRPDLLKRQPSDWDGVLVLARQTRGSSGMVALPLIPTDAYASFLSLCANHGEAPFMRSDRVVGQETGMKVLSLMLALADSVHPASTQLNPPRLLDMMAETDEVAFSPLLFGYSNYSRASFRKKTLVFGDIPSAGQGPKGSLLGGAGIAVSSRSRMVEEASHFAAWVCRPDVQRGLYFRAGGQPGNGSAWTDPDVNLQCGGFFERTWRTMQMAYLRPRYAGYIALQTALGELIHAFLRSPSDPGRLMKEMNSLYRDGLPKGS